MTDQTPENTEQGWGEDGAVVPTTAPVSYPETPSNPHNHRFTISVDGRGPMIVVRAQSAEEVNAAFQELNDANTGTLLGNFWSQFKAEGQVASGLGGATPVQGAPVAPGAPQGAPTPPPFGPNVSVPQAPGYAGPPAPPAPPQNGGGNWGNGQNNGAMQDRKPEYQQAGWYRLTVPFPKKGEFDGIAQQYQMQKGRPGENGHFSFNKADKSWYVHPQYAGAFPQFSPVPA